MVVGTTTTREFVQNLWHRTKSAPEDALPEIEALLADPSSHLPREVLLKLQSAHARALANINKLNDAIAVVEIAEATLNEGQISDVEIEFELRRIRVRQAAQNNQGQKALELVLQNLELVSAQPEGAIYALAHSDVAAVYGSIANFRLTLKHLQEGLKHTPREDYAQYGTLLNNLGNVYILMDREEEALACFTRARGEFAKADALPRKAIAISNEGRALEALGRFEESITKQKEALAMFRSLAYGHDEVATLYKIGNTYARSGNAAEAERKYQLAIARIHDGGADGYEDELRRAYAEFLTDEGRFREAATQFGILVEITRETGTLKQIARNLRTYAVSLERVGETEMALATYKELLTLRDVLDQQTEQTDARDALPELSEAVEKDLTLLQATSRALAEANKLLAEQSRELTKLAITDELTGLYNRRHFTEQLSAEVAGAQQEGRPFSLIFLDIDWFKRINDTYGHHIGDEVLKELGRILQEVVRGVDVVGRWGGEEFALLLIDADTERARRVAGRLTNAIAAFPWDGVAAGLRVSISAGVISDADLSVVEVEEVMQLADHLLYAAKEAGRNRILFAADERTTNMQQLE